MEKFRDKYGHEWTIDLDLGIAEEIEAYDFRNQCPPVKLMPPSDDFFTTRILDAKVIFGITWICIQHQIEKFNRSVSLRIPDASQHTGSPPEKIDEPAFRQIHNELDFAHRLDGKSIGEMKKAVWGELPNFFPEAATSLKTLMTRFSRVQEVANSKLEAAISRVTSDKMSDQQIEAMIDQQVERMEAEVEERMKGINQ